MADQKVTDLTEKTKIEATDMFYGVDVPGGNLDKKYSGQTVSNLTSSGNLIINGGMDIWQRGTSFATIANGTYVADRFAYEKSGAVVHTVSRDTNVPTVDESGSKFNYSLKIDCTTIDSSIEAGDFCVVSQKIEGYNAKIIMGQLVTLSFWVKATKTGIYCVSFRNSGFDRSYVIEFTINTTLTWEKKTVTFTFNNGSAGTWDYTTGFGVDITWVLSCGSTFQTTANAWQTGNYLATSNQVNATDSTDNNFWLTGVQFEAGSIATSFKFRQYTEELALCQRYYAKTYNINVTPGTATGVGQLSGISNGNLNRPIISWNLPVQMRDTPVSTFYSPNTGASGKCYVFGIGDVDATSYNPGSSIVSVYASTTVAANIEVDLHIVVSSEL